MGFNPNKIAVTVVAWSEKNSNDKWQVCFRVVWWDLQHQLHLGGVKTISDSNYDFTYPTVSAAYHYTLVEMLGPTKVNDEEDSFEVDLACEVNDGDDQFICYQRFHCSPWDGEDFTFDGFSEDGDAVIMPYPGTPVTCRHPDIVRFIYPGDTVNGELDTVFVVYECETGSAYTIKMWNTEEGGSTIVSYSKTPQGLDPYRKPEYPRIDCGRDDVYTGGDPLVAKCTATTVWHIKKWDDYGYLDYDWDLEALDISGFFSINETPTIDNDDERWDAYPAIDYDPAWGGLGGYRFAHITFTQATEDSNNEDFRVMYTDSLRLQYSQYDIIYNPTGSGRLAGMSTIVMYFTQGIQSQGGDTYPDFGVYFISNGVDGTYRYYSGKFYYTAVDNNGYLDFTASTCPGQIDEIGYPIVPHPRPPVGALFNNSSDLVGYKYWAQNGQHHIWGKYEEGNNIPPVADFMYAPQFGNNPLNVHFLDSSYDPDGLIVKLECDWLYESDEEFDFPDIPLEFSHYFLTSGPNPFTLTVTDDSGATDDFVGTVIVY